MKIAVLGSLESWYVKDLQRAATNRHTISPITFSDLRSTLTSGPMAASSGDIDLRDADAVLVRTMPPGSLEQVVMRMDVLGQLAAAGTLVMNPPRSIEVAVDKYLATARLSAAGLAVPRTIVCQTSDDAMAAFSELGGDAVLKPIFGAEGRGITRLTDEALALRAFKMLEQLGAVIYLQQFIEHEGCDLRLLVIGEQVLGMRRCNPDDWRTNVSLGARTSPLEVSSELESLARTAAAAVGAPFSGVDLLPGRDGNLYAIEVNAVPGWKALARTLDTDIAQRVLDYLESAR